MFSKPAHTVSSRQRYGNQGELKSPSSSSNSLSSCLLWTEGCSEAPGYLNFLAFSQSTGDEWEANILLTVHIPPQYLCHLLSTKHTEKQLPNSQIYFFIFYILFLCVCVQCPDYRSRHQISWSKSHRQLWAANWSVFWEQSPVFCMNNMHALLTAEPVSSVSGALLGFPSVNRMTHIKCNGFCKNLNFFILWLQASSSKVHTLPHSSLKNIYLLSENLRL